MSWVEGLWQETGSKLPDFPTILGFVILYMVWWCCKHTATPQHQTVTTIEPTGTEEASTSESGSATMPRAIVVTIRDARVQSLLSAEPSALRLELRMEDDRGTAPQPPPAVSDAESDAASVYVEPV